MDEFNRQACLLYCKDWEKAKASGDVDHMWQVIGRAAHHLHTSLAELPCPPGQSRKQARAVHRDEYGPGKHCEGLPVALPMRQLAHAARHLANLAGLIAKGHTDTHPAVAQLRAALLRDAKLCPLAALECQMAARTSALAELKLAHQAVLASARLAKTEVRAGQRDQWHQWLTDHQSRGSGVVYRWIRDGPHQPTALTARRGQEGTRQEARRGHL